MILDEIKEGERFICLDDLDKLIYIKKSEGLSQHSTLVFREGLNSGYLEAWTYLNNKTKIQKI